MPNRTNSQPRSASTFPLLVLFGALAGALPAADSGPIVAVGDSLAAGFQNFSLLSTQQVSSFANLISVQANQPMSLPLMASPGIPNPLRLKRGIPSSLAGFVACTDALLMRTNAICEVAPGTLPPLPRELPIRQPTNLAVPGVTVHQALTKTPVPPDQVQSAVDAMTNLILGIPGPPLGLAGSQVDQAVALDPSTVLLWIGANDVLMAGLSGDFTMLTRVDRFYSSFKTLTDRLAATGARMVIANIPDVTVVPYFMSPQTLARQTGFSVSTITWKLGMGSRDYLRPGAVSIALDILAGRRSGPLPDTCPATVPGLPFTTVPCVLKGSQADLMRATVFAFNLVILERAIARRAVFIDTYSLLNQIKENGFIANKRKLTMDYLGGFFTLDAIHPTNTGHAIIANEWIKTMNSRLGMDIPLVSVDRIAQNDPLVQ